MDEGTLLLTLPEAGVELRKSVWTIRRLIRAGTLKAIRVPPGQALRIRRADLEQFVKRMPTTVDRGDVLLRGRR